MRTTPESEKLRLVEVRLEGFRGINKAVSLRCGDATTLLLAPNGKGKTSLLGGIEWGLFGMLNFQPAENRANDELVNLHHPRSSAKADIVLAGNGMTYTVSRTRGLRSRSSTVSVKVSDGQEFEGPDAEAYLFQILGLTWEDFSRAVFLHQESIRGLLIDVPEVRDGSLDRLFGLEKLRNVSAAIPVKVVTDAVEEVRRRTELTTTRLEGAVEEVEQQRVKHLADAKAKGFAEKDLTLEKGIALARQLNLQLESVAKEGKFGLPPGGELEALEDLERVSRRAKEYTKQLRLAVARTSSSGEITKRIGELDLVSDGLEATEGQLTDATKALQTHEEKWGDEKNALTRKTELENEIGKLEHERSVLNVQARLLAGAIEYLKAEPHTSNCPVCAQKIDPIRLAEELERRGRSSQDNAGVLLHEKIAERRERLAEGEQAIQNGLQFRKALHKAEDAFKESLEGITASYPEATTAAKAKEAIRDAQRTLHKKLEELTRADAKRAEKLQEIDERVEALRALYRFLGTDARFEAISAKKPEEAGTDPIQEELDNLLELQESLQTIGRAINEVAKSRASKAIEESKAAISMFYQRLCNHPYFDGIHVDTEEKNVRGITRNTYTVHARATLDERETLASSRLSTSQMNCVALSIYLALARILTHHLGFVILDDPSQNFDTEHKLALAKVLRGIQSQTQLLVATEDSEFQAILQRELAGDTTRVYRLAWEPIAGTTVAPST